MRKIIGLTIGLTMLVLPVTANAAFQRNRTDWDAMSDSGRAGYIMGVFDMRVDHFATDNSPTDRAIRSGYAKCTVDLKLTAGAMAKLVSEGYQADASKYSTPPSWMLLNQMSKVCRSYVDAERVKLGLSPLPQ